MAELARAQWRAIAQARWRLFFNALRTTRGGLEEAARIWAGFLFSMLGLMGATGLGGATWYLLARGRGESIAALLWPILAFWQIFPIVTSASGEPADTANLLRFPLSYPAYFGVRLAYGACDATTLVGCLCLAGMTLGAEAARGALLPRAALAFALFAAFNILLGQTIFAWLERWLAKRRTREFLGALVLLLAIGFQLIGPLARRYGGRPSAAVQFARLAFPYQRWLPPGLAARALAASLPGAVAATAALAGFGLLALGLLHLRLTAEFHGENLSEGARPAAAPKAPESGAARTGASAQSGTPGFLELAWAVMAKELRYLMRSPPMYFTLAMPAVLVFLIAVQGEGAARPGHMAHAGLGGYGFPVGIVYAMLTLKNLAYNAFGTDQAGAQMYYLAPIHFRQVVVGKNLAYAAVLAAEAIAVYLVATLVVAPPAVWLVTLTLAYLVCAALVNFSVGNLLSFYMPRKMDLSRRGRQGGKTTSGLVSLGVQAGLGICIAAAAVLPRDRAEAAVLAAALAGAAAVGYRHVLGRMPGLALAQRENLLAALCKE